MDSNLQRKAGAGHLTPNCSGGATDWPTIDLANQIGSNWYERAVFLKIGCSLSGLKSFNKGNSLTRFCSSNLSLWKLLCLVINDWQRLSPLTWSWTCYFPAAYSLMPAFQIHYLPSHVADFVVRHLCSKVKERLVAFKQSLSRCAYSSCGQRVDKSGRNAVDNCRKHIAFCPWALRDALACADIQCELYTCSFLIKGREISEMYRTQQPLEW